MWGSKKPAPAAPSGAAVAVQTIPREFYAGADPVVTFRTVKKEIAWRQNSNHASPSKASRGAPLEPALARASRFLAAGHHIWWLLAGLLAVFILGAGWYYWRSATRSPATVIPPPATAPVLPTPAPEEAVTAVPSQPPEAPTTTAESAPPPGEARLEFPSLLLGDSADSDSDALTDAEEELFGTDPSVPDTDNDRYPDGHEVYNLYNPEGREPEKLIENGRVLNWQNPVFGYQVYYPASWTVAPVDLEFREVLWSAITGEFISVRAAPKRAPYASFADWLAALAPGERLSDIADFTSAFKTPGQRRSDYLVYYFEDDNHIYVMTYHAALGGAINYRLVIKMMARSFRLPGGGEETIPARVDAESQAAEAAASGTVNGSSVVDGKPAPATSSPPL